MGTYLDQLKEATLARVETEKRKRSFNDLDREAGDLPEPRDFEGALRAEGMSLIAEIKRASPSAGAIQVDVDPAKTAEAYERGGARALSVLTEPRFFLGSLDDLQAGRAAGRLPALRKDFMLDPYQIVQSRVEQADAILLIVAALPDRGLYSDMVAAAREYDLATLIEVHDAYELELAFKVDASIVGINQRNLMTFEVDRGLAARLRTFVPQEVAVVAESGVESRSQVEELEAAGIDAVLVGEILMRAEDPAAAVSELLGSPID